MMDKSVKKINNNKKQNKTKTSKKKNKTKKQNKKKHENTFDFLNIYNPFSKMLKITSPVTRICNCLPNSKLM